MKNPARLVLWIAAAFYPIVVFLGLVYFKMPPRALALFIVVAALTSFLSATSKRKAALPASGESIGDGGAGVRPRHRLGAPVASILPALAGLVLAIAVAASDSPALLKLYPVIMTASFLGSFAYSLARPPSIILGFAMLADRDLPSRPEYPGVERYCRNVTIVWIGFFLLNIAISAYTSFFASDLAWSVYNGLISYLLMGAIFVGEIAVRRFIIR